MSQCYFSNFTKVTQLHFKFVRSGVRKNIENEKLVSLIPFFSFYGTQAVSFKDFKGFYISNRMEGANEPDMDPGICHVISPARFSVEKSLDNGGQILED